MTWLDDLAEFDRKATPGDWRVHHMPAPVGGISIHTADGNTCIAYDRSDLSAADAMLIAEARNAIPRLVAMARAGEALVAAIGKLDSSPEDDEEAGLTSALRAWEEASK